MISINILSGLVPAVQLVLIVGLVVTVLLVTCSRTAATNLATFLRDLYDIYLWHRTSRQQRHSCQEETEDEDDKMRSATIDAVKETALLLGSEASELSSEEREKKHV